MRKFLTGAWPTIEQFPQFMAMNLKKLSVGDSPGEDLARRYLIRNIRVEQKHAEHWVDWAHAGRPEPRRPEARPTTSKARRRWRTGAGTSATGPAWRWRSPRPTTRSRASTGEWACIVCSESTYADSLPEEIRGPATRWLRLHAEYDDNHPWEALEIVATLLGHSPPAAEIEAVRRAIRATYYYSEMGLNHAAAGCCTAASTKPRRTPRPWARSTPPSRLAPRGRAQLSESSWAAAFSLLSAVESIFICASNWRAAAIIATIVSTALTFEPSSAPSARRASASAASSPSAARNRPSAPRVERRLPA